MTLLERRIVGLPGALTLAGALFALVAPGCGGGSSGGGTGGTSGAGGSNLDAKLDVATAKDLPTGTGGTVGAPDLGPDLPPIVSTGGTVVMDGGSDVSTSGPEAGRDVAMDGSSTDGTPDVALLPDGGRLPDMPGIDGSHSIDLGPVDTTGSEASPATCQAPATAKNFYLQNLKTIAWAKDGSLVTAGTFYPNNLAFGSKTLTSKGSADMFAAGINPATGDATWLLTAGDSKDQKATQVAVSSNAVAGVIGTFTGTLPIPQSDPTSWITNPTASEINYIAGIDSAAGTGLWSTSVDLGTTGGLTAIAGNAGKDYFVVCGVASNSAADLGITTTNGGGKDVVVAAIKASDGTILWSNMYGGAMDQLCSTATMDDNGDVLLAGQYTGTLNFGNGALTPAPTASTARLLWVAKLSGATGAAIATASFGTSGQIFPQSIAADAQGNVLLAGGFSAAFTVGTTTLTPLTDASHSDTFALKLTSGLAPVWARRWGGNGANFISSAYGIAADSKGNPAVVGNFYGTIDIGPNGSVLTSQAPLNAFDIFVVSLDGATGATTCAHRYGDSGATAYQGANAVAVNRWASGAGKDGTAIVGNYVSTLDFGPPTTALSAGTVSSQAAYLLEIQP
jgi:hypothetical protein